MENRHYLYKSISALKYPVGVGKPLSEPIPTFEPQGCELECMAKEHTRQRVLWMLGRRTIPISRDDLLREANDRPETEAAIDWLVGQNLIAVEKDCMFRITGFGWRTIRQAHGR